MKKIDMTVGIYDTEATLINHRNGDVSIKIPFVKWTGNTGFLAFQKERFDSTDERVETIKAIFSEEGSEEYESLNEFLCYCCSDKGW